MTDKEMLAILQKKLDKGMALFNEQWQQCPASELVDMASEIAATKMVYDALSDGGCSSEYLEYLLRFENPLEVIRDQWISEQTVDYSEGLNHALWTLCNKGDAEQEYEIDPEYAPVSDEDEKITVREFIERHPDKDFDMMTPGGYVYLTPEKAQLLLSGQSVKGHPGNPEYSRDVPEEELLDQEICHAYFAKGAWHILSNFSQEPEQAPFEQGVTMC